ncbi:MAG: hypothetical protein JF631_12265 [Mycobacterium sp.]|nr:hypothetical protein [Mycobacterium sp.]
MGRGGDALIDPALRGGCRQIEPVRGAFVVGGGELQSLFVDVTYADLTDPLTELVSAFVGAIRCRFQIAGHQTGAVAGQLVRQPWRNQHTVFLASGAIRGRHGERPIDADGQAPHGS